MNDEKGARADDPNDNATIGVMAHQEVDWRWCVVVLPRLLVRAERRETRKEVQVIQNGHQSHMDVSISHRRRLREVAAGGYWLFASTSPVRLCAASDNGRDIRVACVVGRAGLVWLCGR